MMNYWLVRAKWGVENKKAEFINNDEWINGYNDKYLEIVKRVETEDILLLAEDSTITHYGVCIDNPKDGKHLTVDKWELLEKPLLYPTTESYKKPISQINNLDEFRREILVAIKITKIKNDVKITDISIENFTMFKKEYLEFSDKLNIVIGENGLGKTHLLKLLYVLISSYNTFSKDRIQSNLSGIFKTESLYNLISWSKNECNISFTVTNNTISFSINANSEVVQDFKSISFGKKCVFISSKEILSFYEGFRSLYENRELSFDKTYKDLADKLGSLYLKNIESYPVEYKLLCKLEKILEGKILLEQDRFYLVSHKDNRKTEITLIAEGLRKIGMIAQLLANGSLTKNSILFWDEPETNLNPRLIKKMAEVLVELSRAGMQIFIATHSLFLVKEIEILRNKQDKVKYFGFGLNEDKEVRVSQSEEFEYLERLVALE